MTSTDDNKVSVRGAGMEWTSLRPNEFPVLFSGGGWQDAQGGIRPDILNTGAANIETENNIATQMGHGSRMIDVPLARMNTERLANTNPEYSFAQFKSGNQNPDVLTQDKVQLTTTMDGATHDLFVHVDPRENTNAEVLMQLAGIHSMVTRDMIERGNADPEVSWKPPLSNPFANKRPIVRSNLATGQEFFAPGQSYEYGTVPKLYTAAQQRAINTNTATGLRKTNTRKNTGTLMASLETKDDMYKEIEKVQGSLDQEMGMYDKSWVNDQDALLAPSRFKGAEYLATQPGLVNVARSQHHKYKKSKHVGKLNTILVGS